MWQQTLPETIVMEVRRHRVVAAMLVVSVVLAMGAQRLAPASSPMDTPSVTSIELTASKKKKSGAIVVTQFTTTETIPFQTMQVTDSQLAVGSSYVKRPGVPGLRHVTYEVTTENGREMGRGIIRNATVKPPVEELIAVGY